MLLVKKSEGFNGTVQKKVMKERKGKEKQGLNINKNSYSCVINTHTHSYASIESKSVNYI